MPLNIDEFLNKYKEATQERWDTTSISVMVFGPSTNSSKLSSKLRNYIINKCNEYGVTLRCEHSGFINIHREKLGSKKNLIFAELDAARFVDVIIIIPDSPGSFVELGMLSPFKNIHRNILILFNDKYEKDNNSFIYSGPKLAYEENNAKVLYVSYRKKQSTWETVKSFLLEKKASKYEGDIVRDLVGT
ncbi:hypothetical protein ACFLUL_01020 [Chloroflexota bacterium]